jgi:hypothetical protein
MLYSLRAWYSGHFGFAQHIVGRRDDGGEVGDDAGIVADARKRLDFSHGKPFQMRDGAGHKLWHMSGRICAAWGK